MRELCGKEIENLATNPMQAFGRDWMALAAGGKDRGFNAMTIAWGHFGTIWERTTHANHLPTAVVYVRPGRYTKQFMDAEPYFTLSAFGPEQKKALAYLGTHSGRDGDKITASGLSPVFLEDPDTVYFEEAHTVYICRKLYQAPLVEEGFVDRELIDFNYPERDYHKMYIGEIVKVLVF